jgi:alpha-tubulin suppressor-like RCC1 family protein
MSITLPDAGLPDASLMDAGTDANLDASTGDDAFCEASRPTSVAPSTLCVGKHFGCAIVAGRVHCWGSSGSGQLGNGTDLHTPPVHPNCTSGHPCTDVPSTVLREDGTQLSNVTSIGCGDQVCALNDSGEVWCWGYVVGSIFARARRYTTGASSIAVGSRHACARRGDQYVCWGTNFANVLDYPEFENRVDRRLGSGVSEVSYALPADDFAGSERIAGGSAFTCSVRCGGLYCQGWSEGAVCGNDPVFQSDGVHGIRVVVPEGNRILDGHPDDIHAGYTHACVLEDGVVSCFGSDNNGALGNSEGTVDCNTNSVYRCRPRARPIDIDAFPGLRFSALAHGMSGTSCAIVEGSGEVYCWGQGESGQAGGVESWTTAVHGPVEGDGGPLTNVTEVAVGDTSSCARRSDGAVYCWGGNTWSELARPSDDIARTTALVVSLP